MFIVYEIVAYGYISVKTIQCFTIQLEIAFVDIGYKMLPFLSAHNGLTDYNKARGFWPTDPIIISSWRSIKEQPPDKPV